MGLTRFYDLVVLLVLLITMATTIQAATVGDSLVNSKLDGNELIKMGEVLNKPLLILLGKTFVSEKQNIQKESASEDKVLKEELCKLKRCSEWSGWTECSTKVYGTFGASTRSRTCGGSSSLCPSNAASEEENDSRICQGRKCKSVKYTQTKHGFCIRVSNTVYKSWTAAQEECHKDGGYLINIDSELKARDINETLNTLSGTGPLWIDGKRTLPNGVWVYETGPEDSGYSNWLSGEPGSTDDCRAYVMHSGVRYWFGRKCTAKYYFLCEMS